MRWLVALALLTGCGARALDLGGNVSVVDISDPIVVDLASPADLVNVCAPSCPTQLPGPGQLCCYPQPACMLADCTCSCTAPQENLSPHWECACGL